jgi:hypothetical protein
MQALRLKERNREKARNAKHRVSANLRDRKPPKHQVRLITSAFSALQTLKVGKAFFSETGRRALCWRPRLEAAVPLARKGGWN